MKHTIVLQTELQSAAHNYKTALSKAQTALKKLFKLSDYPTPSSLADVTAQRLASFVADRCVAVLGTPIFTKEQKDKTVSDWIEWKVKAMPHVAAVEKFVNDWRDVNPILDGDTIATDDITEALAPRFTTEVPEDAYRHVSLIADVRQAIDNLRDFEKLLDLKKIPLIELLQMNEDILLQAWSNGNIKVNHSGETDGSRRWREAIYAATL